MNNEKRKMKDTCLTKGKRDKERGKKHNHR